MGLSKNKVIYVFKEVGRNDICKIGSCSKGGKDRFKEGFCVNPRGIDVVSMWSFPTTEAMRSAEREAQNGLVKFTLADGVEWFKISPDEATNRLTGVFGAPTYTPATLPFSPREMYLGEPYDMYRERSDVYRGNLVQRRIWIHREVGPGGYVKVSHNTWWCAGRSVSSNAKRSTYNTRGLEIAACFAFPVPQRDPDWEQEVRRTNPKIVEIWEAIVARHNITAPPALRCGWTRSSPEVLFEALTNEGLKRLLLDPSRPPRGVKAVAKN